MINYDSKISQCEQDIKALENNLRKLKEEKLKSEVFKFKDGDIIESNENKYVFFHKGEGVVVLWADSRTSSRQVRKTDYVLLPSWGYDPIGKTIVGNIFD